ncbi:MAG TPA: hypothetical protein PLL75_01990, partial [Candidatus Omnitrophota bacterium]|nr:hypothetical protein [Candidatus Omnitrophota bacterium]
VSIVVDDQVSGSETATGKVEIRLTGLDYDPLLTVSGAGLTDLGALAPVVGGVEPCGANRLICRESDGTLNTVTGLTQTGRNSFSFGYDLSVGVANDALKDYRRWAAGSLTFEDGKLLNASTDFVFEVSATGLSGKGGYHLDVVDSNNRVVTLRFPATSGRFVMTDELLNEAGIDGFDATQIKTLVLVVDDKVATTGTVTMNVTGLSYSPLISPSVHNINLVSLLPGFPWIGKGFGSVTGDVDGTISVSQGTSTAFNFTYTLPDSDDFVYAQAGWGYFRDPSAPTVSNFEYVRNVGFKLTLANLGEVSSYDMQYSDDDGATWKTAQSGIATHGAETMTWTDDGSFTDPDPLQASGFRSYRVQVVSPAQVFQGMPQDLHGGFTFAANGADKGLMKVEVVDVNGVKASFWVELKGEFKNYTIPFNAADLPTGFDAYHVAMVNFVADQDHMGTGGTVSIEAKGLHYVETVNADPTLDATDIDLLTGIVGLGSFASKEPSATGKVSRSSATVFSLKFDVSTAGSYAGTYSSFDKEGTSITEVKNLSGNGTFTLGLSLSAGTGDVVLEFKDITGKTDSVILHGVTTVDQFYKVTLADMQELDFSQIVSINVLVKNGSVTVPKDTTLKVQFGNQPVLTSYPVIDANSTAGLTDLSDYRPGAGAVEPCGAAHNPCLAADGTKDTVTSFTQTNTSQFSFHYNLNNGFNDVDAKDYRRWAAGSLTFSDDKLFDFTAKDLVLDITVTGQSGYKLDVVDENDNKVTLQVTLTSGKIAITDALLKSANITGFDSSKIKSVVVVADEETAAQGDVTVKTTGLDYVPVVAGTATGTLTDLSALTPIAGLMDGVGGVVSNVQSLSSTQFSYQYGPIAGGSGNYGGAILVLGQDTNGSKDGVLESFYSLPGAGLVFKVEGTTALQKIRVSVSDNKVARVVDGKTQYRSVTLEFTVSAGTPYITISAADLVKAAADFDATKISSVTFIADENTVPKPAAGAKNTVTVTGSGFGCIPVVAGTATGTLTDLSALTP